MQNYVVDECAAPVKKHCLLSVHADPHLHTFHRPSHVPGMDFWIFQHPSMPRKSRAFNLQFDVLALGSRKDKRACITSPESAIPPHRMFCTTQIINLKQPVVTDFHMPDYTTSCMEFYWNERGETAVVDDPFAHVDTVDWCRHTSELMRQVVESRGDSMPIGNTSNSCASFLCRLETGFDGL